MRAHTMRNSREILHGDQTRRFSFSQQYNPGKMIWNHHLSSVSLDFEARADVLNDTFMLREDNCRPYLRHKKNSVTE